MVFVAHRQCKQHEAMGTFQHRLSFSRAEIVLINSWMPVQQITYHLLRVYIKTERLTESADNSGAGTLSNYHIKTLMLWACELKRRSWWTENLNFVRICAELLQTLSVWLTDTRYPHYFVNNCNLLDHSFNVGSVAKKLISVDEDYLSSWLVNNYIRQCAQLCPLQISRLLDDVTTSAKLENAVSEIVRWRLDSSLIDLNFTVYFAEGYILSGVSLRSLTARSCVRDMNELTKIDKRFAFYFSAVALLHVARMISKNGFSDKLMNILSTVVGRDSICCHSILSRCKTERNTSELVEFLQKSAVTHLTKYRQLRAQEFGSLITVVTSDFEALYAYKRGAYQQCLRLSTQIVHTLLYAACLHGVLVVRSLFSCLMMTLSH